MKRITYKNNFMKIIAIFLIVVLMMSGSVYAQGFIPDGLDNTYGGKYFRPYAYENNNCMEFYIDGLNLHYRMNPDEDIRMINIAVAKTNLVVIENVYADECGKEVTGVIDFSGFENSTNSMGYIIDVKIFYKNGTSFTLLNTKLNKYSDSLSFTTPAATTANSNYEKFYENLPAETLEYYKSDYIGDEGDEYGQIYRDKAEEITRGIENDYEKAMAIYKWVCENVYYDYDAYNGVGEYDGQSALVALEEKRAVCGGYASLTAMLLQGAGIPARYVYGTAGTDYHAWNYVYIDGKWSFMDTTWGSNNSYENGVFTKGEMSYSNFGMTGQLLSDSRKCLVQSGTIIIDDVIYKEMKYNNEDCYYVYDCVNEFKRDIRIQSTINGKNVRIIETGAFDGNDVRNVYIPETILVIDAQAFKNMSGFTLYIMGNDTEGYVNSFYGCTDFIIYANTDSYIMNHKLEGWKVKEYRNLNWYIDSVKYSSYKTITVNVKHGALLEQPYLVVAVYDNYDCFKEVRRVRTTNNVETYTFKFDDYNYDNYVKVFLVSDYLQIFPYCPSVRARLSGSDISRETFETDHCYGNNYDKSFTYNAVLNNCRNIDITFNGSTYTEEGADFIVLYDMYGNEFKRYSGEELAGRTICVPGKGFTIRLVSNDKYGNFYGFRILKIVENYG